MNNPTFYQITDFQHSIALSGLSAVSSLTFPDTPIGTRFVASFDGTNNSIYGSKYPPDQITEQHTLVGRTPSWLESLASARATYVGGVGASMIQNAGYSGSDLTGAGSVERANEMYRQLKRFVEVEYESGSLNSPLVIDVLGFSRGTGSARHFMNLVDEGGIPNPNYNKDDPNSVQYLVNPKEARFSCLLFDSVVTGQENELDMGIPASCDFALHLCAADERRSMFNMSSILPEAGYEGDPRLNEIFLPGVHSDLGGAWLSHAALLSELAAQTYLCKRGLIDEIQLSPKTLEQMASMDATWYTSINGMLGTALPDYIPEITRQIFSYMDGYPWEPTNGETSITPTDTWKNEPLSAARIAELQQMYPGWTQPWMTGQDSPSVINAQGSSMLADRDGGSILNGSDKSDWLFAGANSALHGNAGADYLYGSGSARLSGGAGADTYVVKAGDTVVDSDHSGKILIDAFASNVSFSREGTTVLVSWAGQQGGPIRIENWFVEDGQGLIPNGLTVEQRVGSRYSAAAPVFLAADISEQVLSLLGTTSGDQMTGLMGYENAFEGGRGADVITGANKADRYSYSLGDEHDTIIEQGQSEGLTDTLKLLLLKEEDTSFSKNGNDLIAHFVDGGSITVKDWFAGDNSKRIESWEFSDRVLTADEITARVGLLLTENNDTYSGSSGRDIVYGLGGDDTLAGNAGNDILYGGSGNDLLDGGKGADTLIGGAGNDILGGAAGSDDAGRLSAGYPYYYNDPGAGNTYIGGLDNDTLNGTTRADLYIFNVGDGHDTITEREVSLQPADQIDILRFGPGISPSDVSVTRSSRDLILSLANGGGSVTIKNWYNTSVDATYQVERVEFDSGAVWSNTELTQRALTVTGTSGNDALTGLDTYSDILIGNLGADVLNGLSGSDTLQGGDGNDTLNGGHGNDLYIYSLGDDWDLITDTQGADTLRFEDLGLSGAEFHRTGFDLEVNFGGNQGMLVKDQFKTTGAPSIDFFLFSGTAYTAEQIAGLITP